MTSAERYLLWYHCFAEPAFGNPCSQQLRDLHDLVLRIERSRTDEHCDLVAVVKNLRCRRQVRLVWNHEWKRAADTAKRVVMFLRRLRHGGFFLNIFREDQTGY